MKHFKIVGDTSTHYGLFDCDAGGERWLAVDGRTGSAR